MGLFGPSMYLQSVLASEAVAVAGRKLGICQESFFCQREDSTSRYVTVRDP